MQAKSRLPTFLGLLALVGLAASATDSYGQLFEFCDDFGKSACQQRDPWEERIETDRHDFTQSAVTVGRGVVQFESGYYIYQWELSEGVTIAGATGFATNGYGDVGFLPDEQSRAVS